MSTFIGVIVGILGLGFLILVHELGHFMVAKATKMRVEEFSIGFGPYLVKRRVGETVYGISAIPLGGYVRVTGMHKEEFDQRVEDLREQEAEEAATRQMRGGHDDKTMAAAAGGLAEQGKSRKPRDPEDALAGKRALTAEEIASTPIERRFYSHPLWHKLLFIVAGVVMNVFVAYVMLYGVVVSQGQYVYPPVVGEVAAGSGAAVAGIEPGDQIVSVAGHPITDWDQMAWEIIKHKGETVEITLLRNGELLTVNAEIKADQEGIGKLGITYGGGDPSHQEVSWTEGFGSAGGLIGGTFLKIFQGIGLMFTGTVPATGSQGLAGVVGIVDLSSQVLQGGFVYYVYFLAVISVSLALVNILPILPLDGGHMVMVIIERIRGRAVSLRVFERISMVGLALFGVIFFVAMYNDIVRIITRG